MSITVTLDDDVLAKLKAASEARGTSVDGVINDLLRVALALGDAGRAEPFEIRPFTGSGAPLVDLDCTARLLEEIEGPDYR